jgi:2-polyprenyl-3-methyl-5-hydroxy-6-metoxy-1,4-benzoquinol methylase
VIVENVGGWGSYGLDKVKDIVRALALYRGQEVIQPGEFRKLEALHGLWGHKAGEVVFDGNHIDQKVDADVRAPERGITVRKFKNGNAHVIFDQAALFHINRALAEFYGEVLPDAEEEDAKPRASTAVSKDLAYYPTPAKVVESIIAHAYIRTDDRVLEPSCGCGRILDALAKRGNPVLGIEVDPGRAAIARAKGHAVVAGNFLDMPPTADFDRVLMNPPFCSRHYLKHVQHALRFLKPGGVLISILPATAWYDHGEVQKLGRCEWQDLPVASFADSGTNVPTGYITMVVPR